MSKKSNTPVFIRYPPDAALAFQRVQTIDRGLVGENVTPKLDFANQGRLAMLEEVVLKKLENRLLFLGERKLTQT